MKEINAEMWNFGRSPNSPITKDEVYNSIISYIENGILKPGEKIRSYRTIALNTNLSKTLVYRVYQRLEVNGWVYAIKGSGTFVASNFPNYELQYPLTRAVKSLPLTLGTPLISNMEKECYHDDYTTIGFDTPGPYYENLLLSYIRSKKYVNIYESISPSSRIKFIEGVDYKAAILDYLNSKRNFMINTDGLEVIVGRNESLQQVFNVLLRPGDVVVNTSPKDKPLRKILNSYVGLEVYDINLDEYFIKNLKKMLAHNNIKALHIRPQCSHLENNSLSNDTCTDLLLLAKQHGFYIVEEDDYHEFWFKNRPFIPLICQNHNGHVIYCGAFSLLSTYLQQTRTIVAAEEFITLLKLNPVPLNPFKDTLTEMAMVDLLNSNKLWLLIKKMQQDMHQNLFDAWMLINNNLSSLVTVKQPSSGLSFWLICPSDEWLKKSIIYLERMEFHIPYFSGTTKPGAGVQKVSLGFGTWDAEKAEQPLKALQAYYNA